MSTLGLKPRTLNFRPNDRRLKGLSQRARSAEDKLKLGSEMALLLALVVLIGLFATGLLALLFLK